MIILPENIDFIACEGEFVKLTYNGKGFKLIKRYSILEIIEMVELAGEIGTTYGTIMITNFQLLFRGVDINN